MRKLTLGASMPPSPGCKVTHHKAGCRSFLSMPPSSCPALAARRLITNHGAGAFSHDESPCSQGWERTGRHGSCTKQGAGAFSKCLPVLAQPWLQGDSSQSRVQELSLNASQFLPSPGCKATLIMIALHASKFLGPALAAQSRVLEFLPTSSFRPWLHGDISSCTKHKAGGGGGGGVPHPLFPLLD